MKLILSIIQSADEADTVQELNKHGYFVTKLSTTGGFLKAKNTTLLIGTDDEKTGACGSKLNLLEDYKFNHNVQVQKYILKEECSRNS